MNNTDLTQAKSHYAVYDGDTVVFRGNSERDCTSWIEYQSIGMLNSDDWRIELDPTPAMSYRIEFYAKQWMTGSYEVLAASKEEAEEFADPFQVETQGRWEEHDLDRHDCELTGVEEVDDEGE